jgi:hypothetical protein
MMLMCGQSNPVWHYWAGIHPGKVGVLVGPSYHTKLKMRKWMPFALDNDAYVAFATKTHWNEHKWRKMLQWAKMVGQSPLWVLIPDVVANKQKTIENWKTYADETASFGWPLAFAVQDGMIEKDVPSDAQVIFVGGSDQFKYRTLPMWTNNFKRVHVGRVNEVSALQICQRLGVESADGSGWFRDTRRMEALEAWMEEKIKLTPNLL